LLLLLSISNLLGSDSAASPFSSTLEPEKWEDFYWPTNWIEWLKSTDKAYLFSRSPASFGISSDLYRPEIGPTRCSLWTTEPSVPLSPPVISRSCLSRHLVPSSAAGYVFVLLHYL
jgi:hypothetical protein